MGELIKLELKKLCRNKLSIIVTLCCFFATIFLFSLPYLQYKAWDENGTMLSMRDAVSYKKECFAKLSGMLTEERIAKDIQEYQEIYRNPKNLMKERGGEISFNDKIYYGYLSPRQSYLDMIGNTYFTNGMGYMNIPDISLKKEASFYEARNEKVNTVVESNIYLSDAEKTYWLHKSTTIAGPYEYGYPLGWTNFGDTAQMLIISILGICIVIAPMFANEYQRGTDAIILSTRYGKSKMIYAKIIAASLFGTVVFILNAVISLLLPLMTFGKAGGSLPLQIMDSTCPYALTFAGASFILIGIAYLVMVGLLSITLFCSAKMKSSFTVLIIDILIVFFPVFLGMGKSNLMQHILHLLPYQALSGLSLFKLYFSYSNGSVVICLLGMIAFVYLLITIIVLPLAGRSFLKHQVY